VNADHHEALVRIPLMPRRNVGFDIATVVTTESPKLHQNHFSFESGQSQRFGVKPLCALISGAGIPTPACRAENVPTGNNAVARRLRSAAIFFVIGILSFRCASLYSQLDGLR
jgi:hypothetical protein